MKGCYLGLASVINSWGLQISVSNIRDVHFLQHLIRSKRKAEVGNYSLFRFYLAPIKFLVYLYLNSDWICHWKTNDFAEIAKCNVFAKCSRLSDPEETKIIPMNRTLIYIFSSNKKWKHKLLLLHLIPTCHQTSLMRNKNYWSEPTWEISTVKAIDLNYFLFKSPMCYCLFITFQMVRTTHTRAQWVT